MAVSGKKIASPLAQRARAFDATEMRAESYRSAPYLDSPKLNPLLTILGSLKFLPGDLHPVAGSFG